MIQMPVSQGIILVLFPTQPGPPFALGILLHTRDCVMILPPHVQIQELEEIHGPHTT